MPPHASGMPRSTSGIENRTSSAASRMSQAAASTSPPPTHVTVERGHRQRATVGERLGGDAAEIGVVAG